jgi:hypothetical protein
VKRGEYTEKMGIFFIHVNHIRPIVALEDINMTARARGLASTHSEWDPAKDFTDAVMDLLVS